MAIETICEWKIRAHPDEPQPTTRDGFAKPPNLGPYYDVEVISAELLGLTEPGDYWIWVRTRSTDSQEKRKDAQGTPHILTVAEETPVEPPPPEGDVRMRGRMIMDLDQSQASNVLEAVRPYVYSVESFVVKDLETQAAIDMLKENG